MDRGDLDILDQFGAARPRALGHGMGDVGRVELAVAGQKHAADHTLSVDQGYSAPISSGVTGRTSSPKTRAIEAPR